VSVFLPLEQSLLSRIVDNKRRTWVMARYSLVGTLLAAFGSLAAALPTMAASYAGFSTRAAVQGMFVLYALLALAAGVVYRGLPKALESAAPAPKEALHASKKRVYTLAALFSLDAFGGGFVVQSLVALWLYQRFGLSIATASAIFFWTGILTAFSYLVAARLALRFGLIKTMVFTHLPSSVCLILIPLMPDLSYAIVLLFIRSALSQMDVPTRSSYVMAIVPPAERAAAASVTSVPRSLASAVSPVLAGYLLGLSPFGWPFVAGGALKIVYDLLLLATFHKVRPPEEEPAPPARE
ncbi:MAG: MFS transporter, partial [Ramlibacter sp.]